MSSPTARRAPLRGSLLLALLALLTPAAVAAAPSPDSPRLAPRGFALIDRLSTMFSANRVLCGLSGRGAICADVNDYVVGGIWPAGTFNKYLYTSGLQLGAVVGPDGGPWTGDTTAAQFADITGFQQHGEPVSGIWTSGNPGDLADWPEAARVPTMGPLAALFPASRRGKPAVGAGDAWFTAWDGNPELNGGRPHPMGVLLETRAIGFGAPAANQDVLYVVSTFYNITSLNSAAYAGYNPATQDMLLERAAAFQSLNETAFGVALPDDGYTLESVHAALLADPDVADGGRNHFTAALPFRMMFAYEHDFREPPGWSFDASLHQPPFFPGAGLVGLQLLRVTTPDVPDAPLTILTDFADGAPQSAAQLLRYLSGQPDFESCNVPGASPICYVNNAAPDDMRGMLGAGPGRLRPGEALTVVTAYAFAAPVAAGSCPGAGCDVSPGNLETVGSLDDAAYVAANGVNLVDSIAGWAGFSDRNGDGRIAADEVEAVGGSLLGKAQLAAQFFDQGFRTPDAPEAPEFFLVPGDDQVTVLWRPSLSETTGDSYFERASDPASPLYDPNYRQFDIEGYRIYRGRTDRPDELTLIAQFDYSGTRFADRLGAVARSAGTPILTECAPELGVFRSCSPGPVVQGIRTTAESAAVDPFGEVIQVRAGDRRLLIDSTVELRRADSALTGAASVAAGTSGPLLTNSGVPFVFVDDGTRNLNGAPAPRNGFGYYYAVTAFDINSYWSGPSSQESARQPKSVSPRPAATNVAVTGTVGAPEIVGRGRVLDPGAAPPTIDPAAGTFSGPFPPADQWELRLEGFAAGLLGRDGAYVVRMDSIRLGSDYANVPHVYWFTVRSGGFSQAFSLPMSLGSETYNEPTVLDTAGTSFRSVRLDPEEAARYGGSSDYFLQGGLTLGRPGSYYSTAKGRGCVNHAAGFDQSGAATGCEYNGSRWFAGPSPEHDETQADPIAGNTANFGSVPMTNYNNAGALPGVVTIFQPQSYQSMPSAYREIEGILEGAFRSADFNVYWGAGGTIDSVVDVTHNVPVPFIGDHLGGSWGVLNQPAALPSAGTADGLDLLTVADFGCVAPLGDPDLLVGFTGWACAGGPAYQLSRTVAPGPIGFYSGGNGADPTSAMPAANAGFGLYLAGQIFLFELEGGAVPAAGTVWSMRSYHGAISGGQGDAGDFGPYVFTPAPRTWTAVGSELRLPFTASTTVRETTDEDLRNVHTVPDPYYVTSAYQQSADEKVIRFVNLPQDAIVRIYSSSGVLVRVLEHHSAQRGGTLDWDVRNRSGRAVASGVYFWHIESFGARRVGRMTILNHDRSRP